VRTVIETESKPETVSENRVEPCQGSRPHVHSTAAEPPRLAVEENLDRARTALDMDVDQLASRQRDPEPRDLRELVAVPGVEMCGQRVRQIAAGLQKNPGSVSHWVSTGAERPSSDPGFAQRLRAFGELIVVERSPHES
jgi:hypothetical protein